MKNLFAWMLALCLLMTCAAAESETAIFLSDSTVTVNGNAISTDPTLPVYLAYVNETHEDVPRELETLHNRVITLTAPAAIASAAQRQTFSLPSKQAVRTASA